MEEAGRQEDSISREVTVILSLLYLRRKKCLPKSMDSSVWRARGGFPWEPLHQRYGFPGKIWTPGEGSWTQVSPSVRMGWSQKAGGLGGQQQVTQQMLGYSFDPGEKEIEASQKCVRNPGLLCSVSSTKPLTFHCSQRWGLQILSLWVMSHTDPITMSDLGPGKAMVFLVVTHGCESWTVMKAEHWRIDAFELWCWRRLLRVS